LATPADPRQQIHAIVDHLRPEQLAQVRGLLEPMLDPVARAIALAPSDDEPVTPEDCAAIDRAMEWFKHNKGIPHEKVLAEFGVNMQTFAAMLEVEEGVGPKS
jgi:hypothetical protein